MDIVLAALCGFLMDLALGDPAWMPHPVVGMGKCIAALERGLRRAFFRKRPGASLRRARCWRPCCRWARWALRRARSGCAALRTRRCALRWRPWCWQALAMRGLRDESRNVYRALTGGTLEQARAAVARIVGRDTAALFPPEA